MIGEKPNIFKSATLTKIFVTLCDVMLGAVCMYAAMQFRYILEQKAIPNNIDIEASLIYALCCLVAWHVIGTSRALWRFTSFSDIRKLLLSICLASLLTPVILFLFFERADAFPRSVPFICAGFHFVALTFFRFVTLLKYTGSLKSLVIWNNRGDNPEAILIGTSRSLNEYITDSYKNDIPQQYNIMGMIDLDASNKGRTIQGLPVLGTLSMLPEIYTSLSGKTAEKITLIATDRRMSRKESQQLVKLSSELGAPLVRVNTHNIGELTPFETADLIGRNQRILDDSPVRKLIEGKRILITGAGGTIGSEIARQVLSFRPETLGLIDISEFNLYEIDRKLQRDFGGNSDYLWRPFLADVTDTNRVEEIIHRQRPHIVIHAAAIKHVRLSNLNPVETLNINVNGTRILLDMCQKFGVESFVLVSTDKAVEPCNIMGASKRIAELLTLSQQPKAQQSKPPKLATCAVRFGNVIASNGSVIPLFEEQIAQGGPVTVTDKKVSRYFMTVKEASALVLQAAALNATQRSTGGNVFVLEMGTPVKIEKLARQLIRLRGLVPDKDIDVVFTGLKPGEKLEEKLHYADEELETTYVSGVLKVSSAPPCAQSIAPDIEILLEAIKDRDLSKIKNAIATLLPDYEANGALLLTKKV